MKAEQNQPVEAELVAYYRPIGIAAIAAALAFCGAQDSHGFVTPFAHPRPNRNGA
jgi:hypothetical protein